MESKAIEPGAAVESPPGRTTTWLERLAYAYGMDAADLEFQCLSFISLLQSLLVRHPEEPQCEHNTDFNLSLWFTFSRDEN